MKIRKSAFAALAAAITLAGTMSPAAAQDKTTQDDSAKWWGSNIPVPTLLSDSTVDWARGSSEWVNLSWTGSEDFSNVQIRVVSRSKDFTIAYPEANDGFTGLSVDSDLSKNEIDVTAFKATTASNSSGSKWAVVYADYTVSTEGSAYEGRRYRAYIGMLRFSNKSYVGDDFLILTEEAKATAGGSSEGNWVDFGYKGLAPYNSNIEVTVKGSDLPVYYPQTEFTSLHHDGVLNAGEVDVARIWLDPLLIEPGTEALEIVVSYSDHRGNAKSLTHKVALSITG